jgi:hypothetical protein
MDIAARALESFALTRSVFTSRVLTRRVAAMPPADAVGIEPSFSLMILAPLQAAGSTRIRKHRTQNTAAAATDISSLYSMQSKRTP